MQKMKTILLLIYVFSHATTSCAFSSISAKSPARTDTFLRASNEGVEEIDIDIAIVDDDDNVNVEAEDDDGSKKKTFYEKELTPEIRSSYDDNIEEIDVDVAIVGAGIGGLCAGAILNTLYNKKVGIYESHYLPGEINVSFSAYHMLKITLYSYYVYAFDVI